VSPRRAVFQGLTARFQVIYYTDLILDMRYTFPTANIESSEGLHCCPRSRESAALLEGAPKQKRK